MLQQRHAATADEMAELSGDGSDSSIAVGEGGDNPVGGKKRSAPVRRRGSVRSRGRNTRAARADLTTDDEVGELNRPCWWGLNVWFFACISRKYVFWREYREHMFFG